jgi:hypothetical protein
MRIIVALIMALTLPVVSFASMRDPSWEGMSFLEIIEAPIIQKEKPLVEFFKKEYGLSQASSERLIKSARATGETLVMLSIMIEEFELDKIFKEKYGKTQTEKHGVMHVSERFLKNEPFKSQIKEKCGITTVKELDTVPMEMNFCAANTAFQILFKKYDNDPSSSVNEYGMGKIKSEYANAVFSKFNYLLKITGEDKD